MYKWIAAAWLSAAPGWAVTVTSYPGDTEGAGATILTGSTTLDGVAKLMILIGSTTYGCSGSLLDSQDILTAAHCVAPGGPGPLPDSATITFPDGTVRTAAGYTVNGGWDGVPTDGGDLAIIHMSQPAPAGIPIYGLYQGSSEATRQDNGHTPVITLAGYGVGGTGAAGEDSSSYPFGSLRQGENRYDATDPSGRILYGDFDNPLGPSPALNDAFGTYSPVFADTDQDIGSLEAMTSHGDSGGPSFLGNLIAGVHSFGTCLTANSQSAACVTPPAVSTSFNSGYGDIFADTNVAAYSSWILASEVPEPGAMALVAPALVLLGWTRRRRSVRIIKIS